MRCSVVKHPRGMCHGEHGVCEPGAGLEARSDGDPHSVCVNNLNAIALGERLGLCELSQHK